MESSSYTDTSLYWQIPYTTKKSIPKASNTQNDLQKHIQILRESMKSSKSAATKSQHKLWPLNRNYNSNKNFWRFYILCFNLGSI